MVAKAGQQPPHDFFFLKHLQAVQGSLGWYCNHRFLGKGGNGTAFLVSGTDGQHIGLQLVLKVFHKISSETRRRAFLEEVRLLRQINHAAIVKIFDEGQYSVRERTYPFAVMEYVPLTARQLLLNHQIDRLKAVRIGLNCLSALKCIHNLPTPLIHRDIKPENILIGDGFAKLADFGLAKELDSSDQDEPEDRQLEDAAENLGSQWPGMPLRYRTPELVDRANGETTEVTPASDIFQFGTVLYELVTGYNPQLPPKQILGEIELDLRDIRGEQGEALTSLISDMLEQNPVHRPVAHQCLLRLNQIHKDVCEALTGVTGQFV